MHSSDEFVKILALKVPGFDSVMKADRNLGRVKHPGAFAIELEGAADTHGHNGRADLLSYRKGSLLKRPNPPSESARAFREDDHTDAVLDMRTNPL
jgi:hypothetical protein